MNKIFLIIKREYLTRVRRKAFILSTFLLPIVMILVIAGSVFIQIKSKEKITIAVPEDNFLKSSLPKDSSDVRFIYDPSVTQNNFDEKKYDGFIRFQKDSADKKIYVLASRKQISIEDESKIESLLTKAYENKLLQIRGIDKVILDSVTDASKDAIDLDTRVVNKQGVEKASNSGLAYGIGFGSGMLIYITMLIFGAMVMRGVMEEKTNRIAEVMVSSVKPFQLMMGKIIGIAAVGLTQFLMWIVLILILFNAAALFLSPETMQHVQQAQGSMPQTGGAGASNAFLQAKTHITEGANWVMIISCFLFYFLFGYLFYAALFAAVGSVVNEDPQEAQSLMFPITMPIIFSFVILTSTINQPNSPLAFWASMIPFSSPIVMMGRIANGVPETVPYWQLILSMAILILGFLATTWFAGKVYRTGILMYGKKPSWKEMFKWVFRK